MPEYGKTIRGLSIAITALSALAIVAALGIAAVTGIATVSAAAENVVSEVTSDLNKSLKNDMGLSASEIKELKELGIDINDIQVTKDDTRGLLGIALLAVCSWAFWSILAAAVGLVAGILGIRRWQQPDRMKAVFVWAIVAAALALTILRFISMVILIVIAVEAYKYRRAFEEGAYDDVELAA